MAESFVNVNEGAGKKLHTFNRTISSQDVHDEVMVLGEPYLAGFVANAPSLSIATANTHLFQLMAGANLPVYVRRIQIYQAALATAAALAEFRLFRLSTAGTGGTATTVGRLDDSTATAGCTAMNLPTTPGTEGQRVWVGHRLMTQTAPAGGGEALLFDLDFEALRLPAIRIPNGTANGLVIKNVTAVANAAVAVDVWLSEAGF